MIANSHLHYLSTMKSKMASGRFSGEAFLIVLTADVVQGRWDRPVNRGKCVYTLYIYTSICIVPMACCVEKGVHMCCPLYVQFFHSYLISSEYIHCCERYCMLLHELAVHVIHTYLTAYILYIHIVHIVHVHMIWCRVIACSSEIWTGDVPQSRSSPLVSLDHGRQPERTPPSETGQCMCLSLLGTAILSSETDSCIDLPAHVQSYSGKPSSSVPCK